MPEGYHVVLKTTHTARFKSITPTTKKNTTNEDDKQRFSQDYMLVSVERHIYIVAKLNMLLRLHPKTLVCTGTTLQLSGKGFSY